jgi:exonuclease III
MKSVEVDRNERRPKAGEGKPSDHAPVVVEFT